MLIVFTDTANRAHESLFAKPEARVADLRAAEAAAAAWPTAAAGQLLIAVTRGRSLRRAPPRKRPRRRQKRIRRRPTRDTNIVFTQCKLLPRICQTNLLLDQISKQETIEEKEGDEKKPLRPILTQRLLIIKYFLKFVRQHKIVDRSFFINVVDFIL
jgi:hypothetical protein